MQCQKAIAAAWAAITHIYLGRIPTNTSRDGEKVICSNLPATLDLLALFRCPGLLHPAVSGCSSFGTLNCHLSCCVFCTLTATYCR